MTLADGLAELARPPARAEEQDRLRVLTATNLAAAVGDLGHVHGFLGSLPRGTGHGANAYRNGAVFHARTQDDFFPGGRSHVGAVVTTAVLALGDRVEIPFFDAVAAGYRVMCAIAGVYSLDAQRRALRPTGVFGPMAAAAASARAIGLDTAGVASAIAVAAALSGGTNQAWIAGSDEWALQAGVATRAGLEAALAVAGGVCGAGDAIEGRAGWGAAFFEDAGATRLRDALDGALPGVCDVAIKPYPISGIAQVPTSLGCAAHRQASGEPIDRAVLYVNPTEAAYPGSLGVSPRTRSSALMSLAFCVSSGLQDGLVRIESLVRPVERGGPPVRVETDPGLTETQARLVVAMGREERVFEGHGADILYPGWTQLRANSGALADRSEACEPTVAAQLTELGRPTPSVTRLAELTHLS